jgi:dTMP kinase
MDAAFLQDLNDFATGGLWPDLTLLLDLPPEMGLERALRRNRTMPSDQAEGRFEAEAPDFHSRIRRGFLERARLHPDRFRILDAAGTPSALEQASWEAIRTKETSF